MREEQPYYWVYMLEVRTGKYYTGYTTDIYRRYGEHLRGTKGSKFTRAFKVARLLRCWKIRENRATVLKIEYWIKNLSRPVKEKLIKRPRDLKKILLKKLEREVSFSCWDGEKIHNKVTKS